MKIIALSGWKGSGKDTAAVALQKLGYTRVAFADILKDMCSEEYGITRSLFDDRQKKEECLPWLPVDPQDPFSEKICDMLDSEFKEGHDGRLYWTPRAIAILKGSINRAVTSKFWTQKAINIIKQSNKNKFVITDLRYISEAHQLKKAFIDSLRIVRIDRFDQNVSLDSSERNLDNYKFDCIVANRSTEVEFMDSIIEMEKEIFDD